MVDESKLRVFISYSHENADAFRAVESTLKGLGHAPMSDQDLSAGGFTEQIQTIIAHSHLFIPILTPESHKRGWVHQEIGFAGTLKVPCVPLYIGMESLPWVIARLLEMIQTLPRHPAWSCDG